MRGFILGLLCVAMLLISADVVQAEDGKYLFITNSGDRYTADSIEVSEKYRRVTLYDAGLEYRLLIARISQAWNPDGGSITAGILRDPIIPGKVAVVLDDGETLTGDRYDVDEQSKVVTLFDGERERAVEIAVIDEVWDDYSEVTLEVFSRAYRPIPDRVPSAPPPVPSQQPNRPREGTPIRPPRHDTTQALTVRMSQPAARPFFVIAPMFSIPAGDLYQVFGPGAGADVSLHVPVGDELAVGLLVNRSGAALERGWSPSGDDLWYYMVSFVWLSPLDFERDKRTMSYFGVGLGAAHIVKARPAQRIYGGIIPMLNEQVGVNVSGAMNITFAGIDGLDNMVYGYTFDFMIGLTLLL